MKNKAGFLFLVNFIVIFSIFFVPNIYAENWSENFTTLDNWTTLRLNCPSGGCGTIDPIPLTNDSSIDSINGALKFPADNNWELVDTAIHKSDLAYGYWSWDLELDSTSVSHKSVDVVGFIYNGANWNLSSAGFTWEGTSGYYLSILEQYESDVYPSVGPGLTLMTADQSVLGSAKFSENIVGSHKIEITRSLVGEFNVSYDGELLITATDNSVTTSEDLVIFSWSGDSGYDNFTISEEPPITTTSITTPPTDSTSRETSTLNFSGLELVSTFLVSLIVIINRRKKKYSE